MVSSKLAAALNPSSLRRILFVVCLGLAGFGLHGCDTVNPPPLPAPTATVAPLIETPLPPTPEPPTPTPAPPTATPTATPRVEQLSTWSWDELVRIRPGKNMVAVTLDAGASGQYLPGILDTLRNRDTRVTMFITGKFAETYPDGVRRAAAEGHEIANHTYWHRDSTRLSDQQLIEELERTEQAIYNLTGVSSKPFWRPPMGARNKRVLSVAASQGYRSIYWTFDSLDSVGKPKSADFIFNRVTNPPGNINLDGAIVLMHFGSKVSADALPRILDRLSEMGLQVVPVSQLLYP